MLGQDAFSTPGWYRATLAAGLPDGAQPAFLIAEADGTVIALLPMLRQRGRLGALVTPYTCLWQPLLAPGLGPVQLHAVGHALGRAWRHHGVVRLEAMPADNPAVGALLAGLRGAGLRLLAFDHFGNWHEDLAGQGWDAYLSARSRRLRTAITRQTKRLAQQPGFAFSLVQGADGMEDAIAAYEAVYAASWKEPEPRPAFNGALMRASASRGHVAPGHPLDRR